jgi:hypothetical protein
MINIQKKNFPIMIILIFFVTLQIHACGTSTPESALKPIPSPTNTATSEMEKYETDLEKLMILSAQSEKDYFICNPSEKSYHHQKLPSDTSYRENWNYEIKIDTKEKKFIIVHDAFSERYFPEECYEFRAWQGDGYGEIIEVEWLAGIMPIELKVTSGCDQLGDSPAYEETWDEYFEWWVIGKFFIETNLKILMCTCNSSGFPYEDQLVESFYNTSSCPPCVPGIMTCSLSSD